MKTLDISSRFTSGTSKRVIRIRIRSKGRMEISNSAPTKRQLLLWPTMLCARLTGWKGWKSWWCWCVPACPSERVRGALARSGATSLIKLSAAGLTTTAGQKKKCCFIFSTLRRRFDEVEAFDIFMYSNLSKIVMGR